MAVRVAVLATLGAIAGSPLAGQVIGVRTVPIAAGDQFGFLPSQNAGMAGVSLALADPLGDPFANPATGGRGTSRFFSSPTAFSVAQGNGAARSLPLGAILVSPTWFAGAAATAQQVVAADQWGFWGGPQPLVDRIAPEPAFGPDRSAANLYIAGLVGRRVGNVTLGVSVSLADLSAVHGVELLYAGSLGLRQFGEAVDVRAGVAIGLPGQRAFEAVVVHDRFSMTHDVTYVETIFDSTVGWWEPQTRVETNLDQTRTTGLHVNYRLPVAPGWTLGLVGTGNYKDHPKIPNYDLANIPRDPGTTWAYNLGLGLAHRDGPATFAAEAIVEPIRSHTWAEAAVPTTTTGGFVIPAGGVTVDNRFRFMNALLRMGLSRDISQATLQLGLQVRSIRYQLTQRDLVAGSSRRQSEDWMEWSPTWGLAIHFPEFDLRYSGRVTSGTGRPSVGWTGGGVTRLAALESADFIVAPSGPLTLQEARVVNHQVVIVLPIH